MTTMQEKTSPHPNTCQLHRRSFCCWGGVLFALALLLPGCTRDFSGITAWEMAAKPVRHAEVGNTQAIQRLLDDGMDVDSVNMRGSAALMAAALNGRSETIDFLLKRGANVNAHDVFGHTALMLAAKNSRADIAQQLDASVGALLSPAAGEPQTATPIAA